MRVISGQYGGRPLKSVKGKNTRPTTDKIKESLFHMIGPYFEGGTALDLYAGSGSLGIEAVSRGMDKCYLVDKHPLAVKTIHENVSITKEENKFKIWKMTDKQAMNRLSEEKQSFDLVLLDPPYDMNKLGNTIAYMLQNNLLNNQAKIVCEMDRKSNITVESNQLKIIKEKLYGTIKILIFEWSLSDD